MDLSNSKTLVTGGSRGIGKAIAAALIARGGKVAITGRDETVLHKTAKEIGAVAIAADVSVEDDAVRAVESAISELGGLDILVNNAGTGTFQALTELDRASFEKVMAVNVTGAMLSAREAAKHFVAQRSGNIINISSTAGTKGMQHGTAYCASKFALRGMTECWREELRRHNVRVILVNPSEVQTGFGGRARPTINPKKLVSEDIAEAICGVLAIDDRGFVPEFSVFATNPF